MKRKILSFIAMCLATAAMGMDFIPDSLKYRILSDGTAEVVSYGGIKNYSRFIEGIAVIPETVVIDGKTRTVTSIGDGAFAKSYDNERGFTAIYLPNTITSIGDRAFYNNSELSYIRLSPNLKHIGDYAFYGCKALGHIALSEKLDTLSSGVLASCLGLYNIGDSQLPNLTCVGGAALSGCRYLRNFTLTDKVTFLGASAFSGCSSLQSIYLPKGLTEIPDGLVNGCLGITEVNLPSGIKRIGAEAFRSSGLTGVNLSQFQGEIGPLAFNYCKSLPRLTLPANNPYCYTSADGKVLYEKGGELLSVLPTVEELVIPYPATGRYTTVITDTLGYWEDGTPDIRTYENYRYPLEGNFFDLRKLEIPYTWNVADNSVTRSAYFSENLQDITVRCQQPFYMNYSWRRDLFPTVSVFSYAQNNFKNASYNLGYWNQFEYQDINRPTEQLYIEEVWPMYDGRKCRLGRDGVVWESGNWNQELEEKCPQYFSSDTYNVIDKFEYREFQLNRYMTDEKVYTYGGQPYEIIHCIDGKIRLSSAFDVNDFVNWYLHTDSVWGNDLYNKQDVAELMTHVKAGTQVDTDGNVSDVDFWSIESSRYYSNLDYALNMVPGIAYDVDLLVAPYHLGKQYYVTSKKDTIPLKERVVYSLLYNNQNEDGQMTQSALDTIFVECNGKVQPIRLYENIQVQGDWGNKLRLRVIKLSGSYSARNGYDEQLNIVGIVAKPKTDIPLLPTGVERPADSAPVPVAYYDLSGRRLSKPVRGVNIVRYSDGSSRRVMVR